MVYIDGDILRFHRIPSCFTAALVQRYWKPRLSAVLLYHVKTCRAIYANDRRKLNRAHDILKMVTEFWIWISMMDIQKHFFSWRVVITGIIFLCTSSHVQLDVPCRQTPARSEQASRAWMYVSEISMGQAEKKEVGHGPGLMCNRPGCRNPARTDHSKSTTLRGRP